MLHSGPTRTLQCRSQTTDGCYGELASVFRVDFLCRYAKTRVKGNLGDRPFNLLEVGGMAYAKRKYFSVFQQKTIDFFREANNFLNCRSQTIFSTNSRNNILFSKITVAPSTMKIKWFVPLSFRIFLSLQFGL